MCFCYAVTRLFVFFSPDVHFGSDLFTEQLNPGLLTPTPQTSGPFGHPKAPQYESGNSMKHIKTKSGAAGQIACDSTLHCPYSVPVQTDAPALQRAPVDALGGYTEAAVPSTLPHLFPHGMDPYMFSKPGLDAGSGMFSCRFLFLQHDVFGWLKKKKWNCYLIAKKYIKMYHIFVFLSVCVRSLYKGWMQVQDNAYSPREHRNVTLHYIPGI